MHNPEHILVFKTNIKDSYCKYKVAKVLDQMDAIETWSVDLTDVDYVLRVVSPVLSTGEVIERVQACGFKCEVLS